jgi:tight adherence protein B
MSAFARQEEGFLAIPDYNSSPSGPLNHAAAFLAGFAAGFGVAFIFYKILPLAFAGGAIAGSANILMASKGASKKRMLRLRGQFFDLLEALSVAMRAGNPPYLALQSARQDLLALYAADSDIMSELDLIMAKFENSIPLSEAFSDFAQRSRLEDIASFASIYRAIEGKNSRADEIVRQTHEIISDKMEIEMEIETMMSAAKSEVGIMLLMPLVILGVIGYAGAGFMDSIYTTPIGRAVSTGGLIVFIISYALAQKFSDVKL